VLCHSDPHMAEKNLNLSFRTSPIPFAGIRNLTTTSLQVQRSNLTPTPASVIISNSLFILFLAQEKYQKKHALEK